MVVERRAFPKRVSLAYIAQNIFFPLKTFDWIMFKTMHTAPFAIQGEKQRDICRLGPNAQNGLQTPRFLIVELLPTTTKRCSGSTIAKRRLTKSCRQIIYRSIEPKYFFDLGWSVSLSRDINIQTIVASRKFLVVEEPR